MSHPYSIKVSSSFLFLSLGILAILPVACTTPASPPLLQQPPEPTTQQTPSTPSDLTTARMTVSVITTAADTSPSMKPAGGRSVQLLGEVASPGWVVIPPDKSMTLLSAIEMANGPTRLADNYVTITRNMPDGTTTIFKYVNLLRVLDKTGSDFALQDGDTVNLRKSLLIAFVGGEQVSAAAINTRARVTKPTGGRSIFVLGQVNRPGWVVIPPDKTLTLVSAIVQANGLTPRASHIISISRKMPDGTTKAIHNVDLYAAMTGTGPDFPLQDGDAFDVLESTTTTLWPATTAEQTAPLTPTIANQSTSGTSENNDPEMKPKGGRSILVVGEVNSPGWVVIPTEKSMTFASAINQAYGVTSRAYHLASIERPEPSGQGQTQYKVDLQASTKGTASDFLLQDGDIIMVYTAAAQTRPAGVRSIQVLGPVTTPGWVVIPPDESMTLVMAVMQANGPTAIASRYVTITRKMPDGTTKVFEHVDLLSALKGTGSDFPLQNGDSVILAESVGMGLE